jgi:hypothetical protein
LSFAFVLLASGTSQPGTLLKSASDLGRIFPDMAERRKKMFGKRNMSVDSYFDLNTSELDRTDHESTDSLRKKIISNLSFGVNGLTPSSKQYMESMEKSAKIAALKPKDWKKVSAKHREKFVQLSEIWENAESINPELITIINDNGVCFKEEFSIGRGSYGTEVYVCLGSDGIERAIKRLPKYLCNLLKNERDILISRNAVESPRVVNYWFYDDNSSPDYGYLILNLYEKNLKEFVKKEGEMTTESRARKMIRQVLEGLKALHSREPRILHRDLKPTNILVDVNGDLVLSDFGIGRFFPEQGIFTGCIYLTK